MSRSLSNFHSSKMDSSNKNVRKNCDRSDSSSSSSSGGASSSSSSSSGPSSPGSPEHKAPGANVFANDGSFLELFKKMEEERRRREQQEEQQQPGADGDEATRSQTQEKKGVTSIVGKRRGGAKLALKTGMVAKKQKLETEGDAAKGDAWAKYMAEVKKYKAHQCGDDDKTRPLVK